MPHKCCVPNCKGNYETGKKVSVFSFPLQDGNLTHAWLRGICREDYVPNKHSRVCELHFQDHHILREVFAYDEKGKKITAPLSYPRLASGAVPSLLPDCPIYLSRLSTSRESPDSKRKRAESQQLAEAIARSIESKEDENNKVCLHNFNDLVSKLGNLECQKEWVIRECDSGVKFLLVLDDDVPNVPWHVHVSNNLNLSTYANGCELKQVGNIKLPFLCSSITDVEKVLSMAYDKFVKKQFCTVPELISMVNDFLERLVQVLPEKKTEIGFLREQILLMTSNSDCRNRYSFDSLLFFSLLYSVSPHSYRFLRKSGKLTLPHPCTLKRVCSALPSDPYYDQRLFLNYMAGKVKLLNVKDKTVVLLMDEIHLKPHVDYKGGNIVGSASNSDECANSAYVFMVTSLLSPYKDVAHILPVKAIKAQELFDVTHRIIVGLEKLGLEMLAIVTDNSAVNRKAVSLFADPPTLQNQYVHPCAKERPLFFVIDSVHILKNIRNNWINKKDKCLKYPSFTPGSSDENIASFSALQQLHAAERTNLIKFGYNLSLKAIDPSSMERQNVKYVLQVFNDKIVAALNELGPRHNFDSWEETATFIKLICRWWDVVNVKTLLKGQRCANNFQEPITLKSIHITNFMQNFMEWLQDWSKFDCGTLTKETHRALADTTEGLLKMANYCLKEKGFSFLLCGKIQTDQLEDRFGIYRRQSGSNYHISVRQIFESESKLRLQHTLPLILKSGQVGQVKMNLTDIKELMLSERMEYENPSDSTDADTLLIEIVVEEDDLDNVGEDTWSLLTYIAGYCSYTAKKKFSCNYCHTFLTGESNNHGSLIETCSRGSLCFPSEDVITCVLYVFVVVKKLVEGANEKCFLRCANHRKTVVALTKANLECSFLFLGHHCQITDHDVPKIIDKILHVAANILLNNYTKKCNDIVRKKTMQDCKRKKYAATK